jgi:hypothetical protein
MDYFGARKKSVPRLLPKRKRKSTRRSTLPKRKPTRQSRTRSELPKHRGCTEQFTKKYTSRPSPPYPANECCHSEKTGHDGHRYISRPNKKGICAWKRL